MSRSLPSALETPDVAELEAAAQWYARLRDESAGEPERAAWRAWLAQSAGHAAAWARIEAVSRRFEPLREAGPPQARAARAGLEAGLGLGPGSGSGMGPGRPRAAERRRALGGLLGVGSLGLLSWLGWRQGPLPELLAAWQADQHTALGERRELALAAGSRLWLNSASALQLQPQGPQRPPLLRLLGGELLAQLQPPPLGPGWKLESGRARLQTQAARFNLRQPRPGERVSRLDVFEGRVLLQAGSEAPRALQAGQAARFDEQGLLSLGPAQAWRQTWTSGRLVAESLPLGELVAELARYQRGHISLAPELADLPVMGVYPLDAPDQALDMLARQLPLRVRRSLPWWTTVEPA